MRGNDFSHIVPQLQVASHLVQGQNSVLVMDIGTLLTMLKVQTKSFQSTQPTWLLELLTSPTLEFYVSTIRQPIFSHIESPNNRYRLISTYGELSIELQP